MIPRDRNRVRCQILCAAFIAASLASAQGLFGPIQAGDTAAFTAALQAGANINATDEYGQTPLMYAVTFNQSDMVEALIAAGADVNARTLAGWTALHYAARDATDIRVLSGLLDAGADPYARNSDRQTPLMLVAEHNRTPQFATLLATAVSEFSAVNADGQTALEIAAASGNSVFQGELATLARAANEAEERERRESESPPAGSLPTLQPASTAELVRAANEVIRALNGEVLGGCPPVPVLAALLQRSDVAVCGIVSNRNPQANRAEAARTLTRLGMRGTIPWTTERAPSGTGELHIMRFDILGWAVVPALWVDYTTVSTIIYVLFARQ